MLTVEVGKEAKKVKVGLPHEASSVWGSIREKIRGASSFTGQIVVSRAIVRRGGIRFDWKEGRENKWDQSFPNETLIWQARNKHPGAMLPLHSIMAQCWEEYFVNSC